MSEIPEDVKRTAEAIAGGYLRFDISCQQLYADVAGAILAERERCAKVAADCADDCRRYAYLGSISGVERAASNAQAHIADKIASAIRSHPQQGDVK